MSTKTRWWLVGVLGVVLVATQACATGTHWDIQGTRWETYMEAAWKAYQQHRYAEAEKFLQAALKEVESFGPQDRRLATSLYGLADVYRAQGKYTEAEPLYQRALAIREKTLGPEHPDVVTSLENYAALLRRTHHDAEAEKLEARAKAIRAKPAQENPTR
ncbi:MAG: tetratricopeptide repeat protein [candidate division NC10 bacterium]|nr:tetratricopeptide repeat protein [candidate division NC10 bacterium]